MRKASFVLRYAVAACMVVPATGQLSAKELTFAYVAANLKIPFNAATSKGFEDAAREAGVTPVVIDPQGDTARQAAAVNDLIARGVDGIGFLPMDSILAQHFADDAKAHNIPTVSVAVQVGDSTKRDVRDVYPTLSALVSTDDVFAGERAAELAARLLPSDHVAKIAIIEGAKGYSAVVQRTSGFRASLDKAGVKYRIVEAQPTDWSPEQGKAACQGFVARYPDIDLIFSQADDMAVGCADALQQSGTKAKLIATGGGSAAGNNAIASGAMAGSVCTRPELLGRLMLKVLFEAATNPGAQKAQFVTYDSTIITKDSLENCPPEW